MSGIYHPLVSRFVSSETAPVFAVSGLPEEEIAVLFAYYSRSSRGLRSALSDLLREKEEAGEQPALTAPFAQPSERARKFHEKWVVGYGHSSVAEHAVVHLAIEDISIVASKALEDARLVSYTEKSTRYVQFTPASLYIPPKFQGVVLDEYRGACTQLFETYARLLSVVQRAIEARAPEGTDASVIRAQALDTVRGLLPAGTRTNVGMTANARALARSIVKLASHELAEARELGDAMRTAGKTVAPTLLKYTDMSPHLRWYRIALPPHMPRFDEPWSNDPASVRLLKFDVDARERIVLALMAELLGDATESNRAVEYARALTDEQRERLIWAALRDRGDHEPALRACEATSYQVRLFIDYGAYRDLQRHRMLSPATSILTARHGYDVPPLIIELGEEDAYRAAMDRAAATWRKLCSPLWCGDPITAQYVVPLGCKHQVIWTLNLRELFHVVELRSGKQGHPSYRRVAQDLYRAVCEVQPWLAELIRVDLNSYDLARG